MEAVTALVSCCIPFLEHFAGSIVEETRFKSVSANKEDATAEDNLLSEISKEDLEGDLVQCDSTYCVYEEYTSPSRSNDRFAWKQSRPSVFMSVVESVLTVSGILLVGGLLLGGLSVLLFNIITNTVNLCHWKDDLDKTLPPRTKSIRFVGYVFTSPYIFTYQTIVFVIVFNWPLVKGQNVLIFSLLASFLDICYRLLLKAFNVYTYRSFQLPYPMNVLFFFLSLANGYLVSRTKFSNSKMKALRMSFKLSIQFLVGCPVMYFILYVICPWYTTMPRGIWRFVAVGATGVLLLLSKIIVRITVSRLRGVVHPENSYILVSFLYGSSSIFLRIMQAELETMRLFCLMGVAHGIVFLLERTAAPISDYLVLRLYNLCFKSDRSNLIRATQRQYKTPRSQRFIADVSIQTMIYESSGLVISLGTLLFYQLFHAQLSSEEKVNAVIQFFKRVLSGLVIEWFFNILAVFIQTRFTNIAIFSVWKLKWRRHVLVALLTSMMTIVCFTVYLLRVVRSQFKVEPEMWKHFSDNCTGIPFSVN